MKNLMLAAAVTSSLATAVLAQAPAAAPAPQTTPVASTMVWIGRHAEFEEYLKTAPIVRIQDVPIGVTHPRRASFAPGGLAASAAVKNIPMGLSMGFWESYKSEIAAYELDRLLELDMVPPTVERRVEKVLMAVQLWVEDCRALKNVDQTQRPDPADWNRQVYRQRVFDNLIANIDENAGNILVDPAWRLVLIDHSRAFAKNDMPFEKQMTHIDRPLFEKLKALDEATLMARIRPWLLNDGSVRAILKRRDKIVQAFEKLTLERGESNVIDP
jgi:hypothetical protein